MIDRMLDWRWITLAILWLGGAPVLLAMVLVGVGGGSWWLVGPALALELAMLIGWTVWAIRYVRSWDDD